MKIVWICGLPYQVQNEVLKDRDFGAHASWSWILGHLPPPEHVELHIACPCVKIRKPETFSYQGAWFHLVPCVPGRLQTAYMFDALCFKSIVRAIDPDVVHGWGTESSYSIIAQSLAPDHSVVQVQGLINAYREYLPQTVAMAYVAYRERRTLNKAKTVFVESGFSAEITRPYVGANTHVIQIDHPLRSAFLDTPHVSGHEHGILFVGSLCERKGYRDAIDAFNRLSDADWKLTLVGGGGVQETAHLQSLIADSPHSRNITHMPEASSNEIVRLMQQSSIFLLPSRMDTGPTALKEALAMGLWPVCYDNSGPKEYITRFDYGSLAITGEPKNLSEKLQAAIHAKPWLCDNRMMEVVKKVRYDLCAATIWKHLLTHYTDVMRAGGERRT